jgi:hypothetical protein
MIFIINGEEAEKFAEQFLLVLIKKRINKHIHFKITINHKESKND